MSVIWAEENWQVDGTDLRTLAYNVQAITEGHGIPPVRGSNLVIPFRHGSRQYRKYYAERRLTLSMFVLGVDPSDGLVAGGKTNLQELYENLDTLRQLFGRRDSLLAITRTLPGGEVRTGVAEVIGTMDFDTVRGALGRFQVEMVMPDPFWRGAAVNNSLAWDATPQNQSVPNVGNFEDVHLTITIAGTCQNPRLTLDGSSPEIFVEVLVTDGPGDTIVIDTQAFTVTKNGSSVIGSLRHQGDPHFFKLMPGANTVVRTSDIVPTATVDFDFFPPHL